MPRAACAPYSLACAQWAAGQAFAQRLTFEQLQNNVVDRTDATDVEEAADIGVRELRDTFRFPLEGREAIRIRGKELRQHLDRDVPFELGVRAIDFAHAASADGV